MTLTVEQQQALDALMAYVPTSSPAVRPAPQPDLLQTWLGISASDLRSGMQKMLAKRDGVEQQVLEWVERRPMDAAFEFLGVASLAFYTVEKGVNPKIDTYIDAFYYIATCASVGYADIFPATHTGRAIASLVMIVGPALAAKALDKPE